MKTGPRPFIVGLATTLLLGVTMGLAPSASAEEAAGASCSAADRSALRMEITSAHAQIQELRLSPEELAAAKAARQKAIADLRAEYGIPGATLTDTQRVELKAKIAAIKEQAESAKADRRAAIDALKATIVADRETLRGCVKA